MESLNVIESMQCRAFDGDNGYHDDDGDGDNSYFDDGDEYYGYASTKFSETAAAELATNCKIIADSLASSLVATIPDFIIPSFDDTAHTYDFYMTHINLRQHINQHFLQKPDFNIAPSETISTERSLVIQQCDYMVCGGSYIK